eukprot:SAG31_NODE_9724_length_1236_cov_4.827617_1_plen_146_part_01
MRHDTVSTCIIIRTMIAVPGRVPRLYFHWQVVYRTTQYHSNAEGEWYYVARIASWVGPIFSVRGCIAFAAKFRGAAPRRAAPRSMGADPAMPCMPWPCNDHAVHRKSRPGEPGTTIIKYSMYITYSLFPVRRVMLSNTKVPWRLF